jgi:hypothetical protein
VIASTAAPGGHRRALGPPVAILAGLAAVVAITFPETLAPRADRLPGVDASIHYAWEVFSRSALAGGVLPFWDPYVLAGTPHLADIQTNVLYPPAVLLRWLPPALSLAWMALLHVWLMGAGALALGRVAGMGWPAAATVAVAVALGGSTAARLYNGHLVVLNSVAWLPLALALALLSVRRGRPSPHPALVLVLVCQFLAGYAQGSLYVAAAVGAWFLFAAAWPDPITDLSLRPRRGQVLAQLGLLGVTALGLVAFQLLPLARLLGEASRTAGIPYEEAVANGWSFRDLAGLYWPFIGAEAEPAVRFMADRAAYVGWLLACAAPFACLDAARRRLAVFFALLAACALVLALGDDLPFYRLHHELFPGLREPGRLLFLTTVGLAVLGGLGLEALVRTGARREWRRLAAPAAVTVAGLLVAASVALGQPEGAVTPMHGWPWLPILAAIGLAGVLAGGARGVPRLALVTALGVTVVDVAAYSSSPDLTTPAGSPEAIRRWLGPADGGRVLSLCENRLATAGVLLAGRGSLSGLGGVRLRDYAEWLELVGSSERPSDRLDTYGVRRDLLDASNVTTIVACEPLTAPQLTLVSDVDGVLAYRNDAAWPRAVWTCAAEELPRAEIVHRLRRGRFEAPGVLAARPIVNVRWAEAVDDAAREAAERRYALMEGAHREGTTWRYVLQDGSRANVLALVADPAVEDTSGIDRGSAVVLVEPVEVPPGRGAERERLVGAGRCEQAGTVRVQVLDRPDGEVGAEVEAAVPGFLYLSEAYYPERAAFVDGMPAEALVANLAFTVVPVPAGRHHVVLRYVPTTFRSGLLVSAATAAAWAVTLWRGRSRPR